MCWVMGMGHSWPQGLSGDKVDPQETELFLEAVGWRGEGASLLLAFSCQPCEGKGYYKPSLSSGDSKENLGGGLRFHAHSL